MAVPHTHGRADFRGKEAHLKFREREHQPATLCTLTMTRNINSTGVARYPVETCPVLDPATGATLIEALGRRSYTTSIAFGPTIGKNIALAYLPHAYCQLGRELQIQYFADVYPVKSRRWATVPCTSRRTSSRVPD